MKRNFKRVISMLLCAAMVVGFLPAIAHVAHATTESGEFNLVLIQEDFETATDSGIPAGWLGYSEIGLNNEIDGTNSFTTDGEDNYYKITYTGSEEETHLAGRHHGIGKITSVANTGGHTKIRLTAKVWTNSTANLISRFDYVVNGVPQPYQNVKDSQLNSTINETTKPAVDNFMREFDLSKFTSGTDVQLVLMQLRDQTSELYLDDVNLEYAHSYTLNRDSGIPVDANDPECVKNFIKCDHCDALKKDDAYATGVDFIYTNGILVDEDFEIEDDQGIPEGWMPATDSESSTPNTTNTNIGYVNGTYKISGNRTGIAIPISLAGSNGHTQVSITAKYSGTGSMISRVYTNVTSGYISSTNKNAAASDADQNGVRKTLFNVADAASASNLQVRFVASSAGYELYLDDILIEYVHTYTQNRDSGVAANAYSNYICCDYCKALKKDDSSATGAMTVITDPSTLAYEDFTFVDPDGMPSTLKPSGDGATYTDYSYYKVGDNSIYKISGDATMTVHHGIAVPFAVSGDTGHTQVRAVVKYSGPGKMISRISGQGNVNEASGFASPADGWKERVTTTDIGTNTNMEATYWLERQLVGPVYLDDIHITYVHTYTDNKPSSVAANAYSSYIKCDHCEALKKNDPFATGDVTVISDPNVLLYEDFTIVDSDGIPDGWLGSYQYSSTTNPYADRGYAEVNGNSVYKIYSSQTAHHGIGIPFSVAVNQYGHTAVRVTAKYSGTGSMISRIYVGSAYYENVNNPPVGNDVRVINFNLASAGTTTSLMATFWLAANYTEIYLDDILIEYAHTYTQDRDSGVAANAYYNYICCDHCNVLKKDDPYATGVVTTLASSATLLYEDFETPGTTYLPDGWTGVNANNSILMNKEQANGNNYYWFNDPNGVASSSAGMKTTLSLADKGNHTQVRISLNTYFAASDPEETFKNELQTSFITYDESNNPLNTSNTGGTPVSYIKNIVATTAPTDADIVWKSESWIKNVADNAATAAFQLVHSRLSTAEMCIDDVLVEYVHTYNENLPGKEASAGVYYIKCDHCDALKANDPHASGDKYIDANGTTYATNCSMTNINLGTNLAMRFAFKKSELPNITGYKAVINIEGEGRSPVEIPSTRWVSATMSGEAYWVVTITGLAAKEMNSSVAIYIEDAEGNPVSATRTTSILEYAESRLQKSDNDLFKTVVVDMLNYGAAAQNQFVYHTDSLANSTLSDAQKELATKEENVKFVEVTSGVVATVSFESDITLKFNPEDDTATFAVITYTPHSSSKEVTKNINVGDGGIFSLKGLVVADYETKVTAKFYASSEDNVLVKEITYSLQQYASNMKEKGSTDTMRILAVEFAKFSTSAYNYIHN